MESLQVSAYEMSERANPAIRATMYELNRHLNAILRQKCAAGADEPELLRRCHELQENFYQMLDNLQVPSAYFDYISHGAFKECYESGIPGWIIKFASENNPTGAERQLVNAASDYRVSEALVTTYYLDLPVYLEANWLEYEQVRQYDEKGLFTHLTDEYEMLNCAMLQPMVEVEENRPYLPLTAFKLKYEERPIVLNSGLPLDFQHVNDLDIDSQDWLQAVVNSYGDKFFFRFLDFMRTFKLSDLHSRNTGYHKVAADTEVPVLLDWMSSF